MGLLKVSEFAEKYDVRRTDLYKYRDRKKIIIIAGYIDEENPINKIFVDSRKTSAKVKPKKTSKEYITTIPNESTNDKITEQTEIKTRKITKAIKDPLYLEFQQTNKLRDAKLEEETRQLKLRNDKIEGRLVSVDAVKKILGEVINRYKAMYNQQVEQLIRDTLNELQAGNKTITEACSKLTDISNESTERSIIEIKINIRNIINESIIS